tara:strand:+ start:41 stop:259 length:219 start_codon:yes stop_codon:yes gene_type:complete
MQTASNNVPSTNLRSPLQPRMHHQPRSTGNSQLQRTRTTERVTLPIVFDIDELERLLFTDPANKENDHPNHP